MPVAYAIDPEHHLAVARLHGVVEDRDVVALARALAAARTEGPGLAQLFDLRGITRAAVAPRVIEAAGRLGGCGPGTRRAFVTASTVVYGLVRTYQNCGEEDAECGIFARVEEALAWLGAAGARAAALLERLPGAAQPA